MIAHAYGFSFGSDLGWLGFWIGLGIAMAGTAIGYGLAERD